MTGTFSSFGTALSALRYQQVSMEVASSNLANMGTAGYVRRRALAEATGTTAVPAMWSRSSEVGNGVRAAGVERMVDPFLDARSRREHASLGYLATRAEVLSRVESGLAEPGTTGVSAAVSGLRSSFQDLVNAPNQDAARAQVLTAANRVADAMRIQVRNIEGEAGDQRGKLLVLAKEVNSLADDLASTNERINAAMASGLDTNILLDARDQIGHRLSQLTGATATLRADGGMDMTLGGQSLVTGKVATAVAVASGVTPTGDADGAPVTFSVGGVAVTGVTGVMGGTAELLTTTFPTHLNGLNAVAKKLADELNAQHALGFDRAGTPGGPLLTYTAGNEAGSLALAFTDPAKLAASGVPSAAGQPGNSDAGNAQKMADAISVQGDYQRLVNGFGSEVAASKRLVANQTVLTSQVDAARDQLGGVNLDEEMLTMVTAQRSYEAAARVITTLDSVLDTLINRTGLTR